MIGEKTRLKLTYADYLTTPEDKRYELPGRRTAHDPRAQ